MKGILFFGDSIVFGRGNMKNHSWVNLFKQDFEKKDFYNCVYNLGIPGETTESLLEHINCDCKSRINKLRNDDEFKIFIQIGMNDLLILNKEEKCFLSSFRLNIRKILKICETYTNKVYFVSITPLKNDINYEGSQYLIRRIEDFNKILKDETNFIDIYNELKSNKYIENLSDNLHPNEKGYEIIYKEFLNKYKTL